MRYFVTSRDKLVVAAVLVVEACFVAVAFFPHFLLLLPAFLAVGVSLALLAFWLNQTFRDNSLRNDAFHGHEPQPVPARQGRLKS